MARRRPTAGYEPRREPPLNYERINRVLSGDKLPVAELQARIVAVFESQPGAALKIMQIEAAIGKHCNLRYALSDLERRHVLYRKPGQAGYQLATQRQENTQP